MARRETTGPSRLTHTHIHADYAVDLTRERTAPRWRSESGGGRRNCEVWSHRLLGAPSQGPASVNGSGGRRSPRTSNGALCPRPGQQSTSRSTPTKGVQSPVSPLVLHLKPLGRCLACRPAEINRHRHAGDASSRCAEKKRHHLRDLRRFEEAFHRLTFKEDVFQHVCFVETVCARLC